MQKTIILSLCACLLLTGCGAPAGSSAEDPQQSGVRQWSRTLDDAMDTVMTLMVYAEDSAVLDDAETLIHSLDGALSVTDENSEIYKLNETGSYTLSEEPAALLGMTLDYCAETEGVLDLSILPVVQAWGFAAGEDKAFLPAAERIPSEETLSQLLTHVDYRKIDFDRETGAVRLPEGMYIDLGSVAKGYTGDRLAALLQEKGVTSALLNLGGNVQAVGSKPDGSPWRIGITDPYDKSTQMGVVEISGKAVVTSGGYERYFEDDDGNVYWHIIDPKTGHPAKNGIVSATVIGENGTYCDALSTALFIMGPEKAEDFWRSHRDFDMVLVTEDDTVILTPGLVDSFSLLGEHDDQLVVVNDEN